MAAAIITPPLASARGSLSGLLFAELDLLLPDALEALLDQAAPVGLREARSQG
jgi:hypothetical protein